MPYEYQSYPAWRYHRDGRAVIITTEEEHAALDADGWRDTPAAFANEPAPETKKRKK